VPATAPDPAPVVTLSGPVVPVQRIPEAPEWVSTTPPEVSRMVLDHHWRLELLNATKPILQEWKPFIRFTILLVIAIGGAYVLTQMNFPQNGVQGLIWMAAFGAGLLVARFRKWLSKRLKSNDPGDE
jgi:hypothetical protein